MFCPYCGSNVLDGASFCSACGKNVTSAQEITSAPAQPAVDYQAQKNAVRQSEINTLAKAIQYFSQKREQFEEYDLVCDLVNDFAKGAKSALLVWGCIITTFGIIATMGAISSGDIIPVMLVILLPGIAMMVGGILMKVNNRKKYEYFQTEYARLSEELYNHYINYPNCPVGPEYANPDILELIMEVLQSGRADTIKESINLLVAEINQSEMNEYLEMIEAHTASINAQTRVAAVFAAANFFRS